jgi:Family of unknown function (DUF5681)
MSDNSESYKTGYKNPPKRWRYKPGQSGNPSGKRKSPKRAEPEDRTKVHEDEMNERIPVRSKSGKTVYMTARRLMYKKLKHQALHEGDIAALKELLKLEKEYASFKLSSQGQQGGVLLLAQPMNPDGSRLTVEQYDNYYKDYSREDVLREQEAVGLRKPGDPILPVGST